MKAFIARAWHGWPEALGAWGGIFLLAFVLLAVFIAFAAIRATPGAPRAVGIQPVDEIKVLPASGVEGFDVAPFCADPLTTVRAFPAPDASGMTYQLTRVRDNRTEAVTLVLGPDRGIVVATHYMDSANGQVSEPAILNDEGRKCVEGKRR